MKTSTITNTHYFTEGGSIYDIIAIDDTHYLLAADQGLLKTTKHQLINHYHKGDHYISLCHVTDSLYLLGLNWHGLILWNEQTNQLLYKISKHRVWSIKRVLSTNNYLIKTFEGVNIVPIYHSEPFKKKLHLLDAKDAFYKTDSLQLHIAHSHFTIATTQNERVGNNKWKNSIKLMKVPIVADM